MFKKKKILFVLNEFVFGSKVRTLVDMVSKLDHEKYEIHVAGHTLDDPAANEIYKLGVPVFQMRLIPPRQFNIEKIVIFFKSLAELKRNKYDVVHTLTYQSLFFDAFFVRVLTNSIFVYSKTNLQWGNHKFNWWLKSFFSHAIVSISSATDELLGRVGFSDKTYKIPIGVDTEYFKYCEEKKHAFRVRHGIDNDSIVFGCAAQFIYWKGHHDLLSAFELLVEKYPNIRLVCCGGNYDDEYYHSLLRKVGGSSALKKSVIFVGVIENMPEFYSAIDCMVLPSTEETFGYVYIEAMSCEKPVIGCNLFGPKDIIDHGRNGYLVEPNAPRELSMLMENYIAKDGVLLDQGRAARRKVLEVFSSDLMVRRHDDLYSSLMGLGG